MGKKSIWACDFETTTEADYRVDGYVRVFLWHARELFSDREAMGYSIEEFVEWCAGTPSEIWFHNLSFDGSYIMSYILEQGWEQSKVQVKGQRTFDTLITDLGQWMQVKLMFGNHVVKIKDSAKKFPGFSLEQVARVYGVEGKGSLYLGYRGEDYEVTDEDRERVRGDTRILKTAMEDLIGRGMTRMTMASDAMEDFRSGYKPKELQRLFPTLSKDMDAWLRAGYKGGWTYVNPEYQMKDVWGVYVYDVNSMYPWAMRYCKLPYGQPVEWDGRPPEGMLYVVEFSCTYRLKEGAFPMIQRRGSFRHIQAEYVTESDGLETLVLTSVDYELFHRCYEVRHEQGHRYFAFNGKHGMFDAYIDKWMAEKVRCSENGDSAGKATAKRFLNSLYGKFGSTPDKKAKVPVIEDGVIRFETVENEMDGGYLPIAMFVTSYARAKVLDMALQFGDDFVYADTDSVHTLHDGSDREIDVDDSRLGAWKLEDWFERGRYLRPKAYVHAHNEGDVVVIDDVKCAGMPDKAKTGVTWENFHNGVEYEGKLVGRQVKGGYCLIGTTYRIKITEENVQMMLGMNEDAIA